MKNQQQQVLHANSSSTMKRDDSSTHHWHVNNKIGWFIMMIVMISQALILLGNLHIVEGAISSIAYRYDLDIQSRMWSRLNYVNGDVERSIIGGNNTFSNGGIVISSNIDMSKNYVSETISLNFTSTSGDCSILSNSMLKVEMVNFKVSASLYNNDTQWISIESVSGSLNNYLELTISENRVDLALNGNTNSFVGMLSSFVNFIKNSSMLILDSQIQTNSFSLTLQNLNADLPYDYSPTTTSRSRIGNFCNMKQDGYCYDMLGNQLEYTEDTLLFYSYLTIGPYCSNIIDFTDDVRCQSESFRKEQAASPGAALVHSATFSVPTSAIASYNGEPFDFLLIDELDSASIPCDQVMLTKNSANSKYSIVLGDGSHCLIYDSNIYFLLGGDFTFSFYFSPYKLGLNMTLFNHVNRFKVLISSENLLVVDLSPFVEGSSIVMDSYLKVNSTYYITITRRTSSEKDYFQARLIGYNIEKVSNISLSINATTDTELKRAYIGRDFQDGLWQFFGSIGGLQYIPKYTSLDEVGTPSIDMCFEIESTDAKVCSGGHGSCKNGTCTCNRPYKGLQCERKIDCSELDLCSGHGTCNFITEKCDCNPGYSGFKCEVKDDPDSVLGVFTGLQKSLDATASYSMDPIVIDFANSNSKSSSGKISGKIKMERNPSSLTSLVEKLITYQSFKNSLIVTLDETWASNNLSSLSSPRFYISKNSGSYWVLEELLLHYSPIVTNGADPTSYTPRAVRLLTNGLDYFALTLNDNNLSIQKYSNQLQAFVSVTVLINLPLTTDLLINGQPIVRNDGTINLYMAYKDHGINQTVYRLSFNSLNTKLDTFYIPNGLKIMPHFSIFNGIEERVITYFNEGIKLFSLSPSLELTQLNDVIGWPDDFLYPSFISAFQTETRIGVYRTLTDTKVLFISPTDNEIPTHKKCDDGTDLPVPPYYFDSSLYAIIPSPPTEKNSINSTGTLSTNTTSYNSSLFVTTNSTTTFNGTVCTPDGQFEDFVLALEKKYNTKFLLTLTIKKISICGYYFTYKKQNITELTISKPMPGTTNSFLDKLVKTQKLNDTMLLSIDTSLVDIEEPIPNIFIVNPSKPNPITNLTLNIPVNTTSRIISNGEDYYALVLDESNHLVVYYYQPIFKDPVSQFVYPEAFTPDQIRYGTPLVRNRALEFYMPILSANSETQTIQKIELDPVSGPSKTVSFNAPKGIPYFFIFDGFDESLVVINEDGSFFYSIIANETLSNNTELSMYYSTTRMNLKNSTRVYQTDSSIVISQDDGSSLVVPSDKQIMPVERNISTILLPNCKTLFFDDVLYQVKLNGSSDSTGTTPSSNSTCNGASCVSDSGGNNQANVTGTSLNTTQTANQTISGNETNIGKKLSVGNNSSTSNSSQSSNSTGVGSNSTLPMNGISLNSTQTINQTSGNETSIGNNSSLSNGTSLNETVNGSLIVNTTSNSSSISTNNSSSDILNTTMNSNSTNGSIINVNSTQTSNTTIVINATDNTNSQVSSNTTISNNGSSDGTNSSQILNGTIIISNNSSSYNNSKLLNSTSSGEGFNSTSDSLSSSNSTQNYNSSNGSNNTISSQNGQTNSTISSNTTGINNTSIGMSESQNETLSQNGTISNNTDNGTNNITNYEAVGGNNSTTNGSLIFGLNNNTVSYGGNATNSQINGNLTNSGNNTLTGSNNATMNNITQNSTNNSNISSNSTLGIFNSGNSNSSFTNQSSVPSNSTNGNMMNNSSLVNNSSNVVNSTNYGSNNNTNNASTNSSSNSTSTNNNGSIGNSTIDSSNSSSTQNNNSSISNGNTTIGNSDSAMNGTTSNSNNTSQLFNETTSNTDKVDNSTIGQVLNSTNNSTANINSTIGDHSSSDSNSTLSQEGVSNNKTSYSNSTTNSSNNGTIPNSDSNKTLSSNNSTMNSGNNSDNISNSDNSTTIDNSTIISTNSSQVTASDNSTTSSNSTESSSVDNSSNSTSSNLTTIDSNHFLPNATNNSTISSVNNSTNNNSNNIFNSTVNNSTTSSNVNSTIPPSSDHKKNPPSPIDNPPITVYIPKVYCFGVEQSSNLSCFGNGKCLSNDSCSCDENYIGSNCSIAVCFGIAGSNSSVCEGNGKCIEANICKCNDGFTGQQCQYQTVTQLCTGSFVPAEQITVSDSNVYLQKSLMDTVCGKSLILQSTTLLEDIPASVNNSNLLKYYTITTDVNVESGDKYLTFDTMLYKSKIPNSLIIWKIDKFSNATQMIIPIVNTQESATYGLVKLLDNPNGDLLGITLKDNSTNVTILEIDTSNKEANISSVFDKGPITFTDIDKGNQVFNPSTNTTTFTFFKEGTSNSSLLLSVNLETPTETPKEIVIPQTTQKYFTLVLYDHPDQYLLSSDQQTTTISTIVPDIDSSNPEFNQLASDSNFVVAKNDLVVLTKDTEKITVTNVNSDVSLIIALSQLTPDPSVFDQSTQLTKFQPIAYINNVQSEATVLSIRRIYPLYVPVTGTIPIYLEGNYVLPGTRPYLILKYDPMDLVVARLPIQTTSSGSRSTFKPFVTAKDLANNLPQELSLMDTFKVSVQIQLISETSDPIPISTNTELTIYRFELLKVLPKQAYYGDKILAMASFFPPTNNVNLFIRPQSATEEIQVPCTVLNSTFCSATLPFLSGSSDTVLNIRASLVQDGVSSKYDNKLFVRYVDPSVVKVTSLDNFDTSISPSEDIPDQDSTPPIIQRQEVAETVQPPLIMKMNIAKLNKSKCTDKPIRQVIASSDLHDISNAVSLDFKLSPFSNIENGNLIEFWISKKNNGTFFGGLSFENGKQVLTGGELSSGVKSSTSCSFSSGVSLRISMKLTESGIRWELKNINLDMIDCILNIGTDNSKILSNPTGYQFGIGQAFTCAQLLSNVSQIPDLIVSSMMEVCITCAKSTLSIDQQDYMPYIVGGSIGLMLLVALCATLVGGVVWYFIRRRKKNIVGKYVYYDNNTERQSTLQDLFEKINTNSSIDSTPTSTEDFVMDDDEDNVDDLITGRTVTYNTWV